MDREFLASELHVVEDDSSRGVYGNEEHRVHLPRSCNRRPLLYGILAFLRSGNTAQPAPRLQGLPPGTAPRRVPSRTAQTPSSSGLIVHGEGEN